MRGREGVGEGSDEGEGKREAQEEKGGKGREGRERKGEKLTN